MRPEEDTTLFNIIRLFDRFYCHRHFLKIIRHLYLTFGAMLTLFMALMQDGHNKIETSDEFSNVLSSLLH